MRLFGRSDHAGEEPDDLKECRHETLTPRWRGPEVMEDESQAMGYVCHACDAEFPTYLVRDRRLLPQG